MALFGHDCGVPPFKNLIFLADIDPDLVWLKWKRRERKKRERKKRGEKKKRREKELLSVVKLSQYIWPKPEEKKERDRKNKK